MIEENTRSFALDANEPSLNEVIGDELSDDEKRRLEWAGVRTLRQLRELHRSADAQAVGQFVEIPAARLRSALQRAAHPFIRQVLPHVSPSQSTLVRIEGANLKQPGSTPVVRISGASVPVLRATANEIVAAPTAQQLGGTLEVETAPGAVATTSFNVREAAGGGDAG
jgi:hypothetical protein